MTTQATSQDAADVVHEQIAELARTAPDAVAVVSGDRRLTRGELQGRARRLAAALQRCGVGREAVVAVLLRRTPELVIAWLGVQRAGGAVLPLDEAYPDERIEHMLADARVGVVITERALAGRLRGNEGRVVICVDELPAASAAEDGAMATAATEPRSPDDLAYVIYTSGSTGRPKGVAVSHRALAALVRWHVAAFSMTEDDRASQLASPGFDAAVWELFGCLAAGSCLHLAPEEARGSATFLRDWLIAEQISLSFVPTPLAEQLLALEWPEVAALRWLLTGGDRLRSYPRAGLPFQLVNNYGPTEDAVVSTSGVVAARRDGDPAAPSIGAAIAGCRLYVLDAELRPVADGESGELYVAGRGLARGYLYKPGLTAERFLPDPFAEAAGQRMYRTGDVARRLASGELEFLGRADDQVKIRGYRIELGEVEVALRGAPGVRDAAVMARADAPGHRRLIAYLVPVSGAEPELVAAVRAHLAQRLPAYMHPGAFVLLPELPLGASGKVDRRALPPPPAIEVSSSAAPRGPREAALAAIWRELLGLEQLGRDASFFELGGDSIIAIQVAARARRVGLAVEPSQVMANPTIAQLAELAIARVDALVDQGSEHGEAPLAPIQRWFFAQELPEPQHFNQTFLLRVTRPLAVEELRAALAQLVQHHDALRLRYQRQGGAWRQWHGETSEAFAVEERELGELAAAPAQACIEEACEELQAALRLESGPLVRAALLRRRPAEGDYLLLVVHHLIVDGVSWRILLEDLEALCQRRGGEAALPALPVKTSSYRRWVEALEAQARGPLLAELPYWAVLADARPRPLPRDRGGPNTGASLQVHWVELDVAETRALVAEVPRAYRTQINDVLLAALVEALAGWTGSRRLYLNLEGHGREPLPGVDVSRTVGWFTSIFPVLLDLEEQREPGEALIAVKEQLRAIPQRGFGFGALRWLSEVANATDGANVAAALAAVPEPDLSFNYLGRFDRGGAADGLFALVRESHASDRSRKNPRKHVLEVDGYIGDGVMRFAWAYSRELHDDATIHGVAARFLTALRALIAHCTSAKVRRLTPSDVPLARLTQPQLDALTRPLGDVEDVWPLSPMQAGLLFHKLRHPQDETYAVQIVGRLQGESDQSIDHEALRRTWERALARHPILRASFHWEALPHPVQVIHSKAAPRWQHEDLRGVPAAERDAAVERWLAEDRRRGFELRQAGPSRFALLQLDEREHLLIWSVHHLALDGWSTWRILHEVLGADDAAQAAPAPGFGGYLAWLARQDLAAAEAFWKRHLAGASPTRAVAEAARNPPAAGALCELKLRLSADETSALLGYARRHGLTPSTVLQGAWGALLARYAGEDDVLFGATAAVRPPELERGEHIAGPLINTLPVRVRAVHGAPLERWLAALQAEQIEARSHLHAPLPEVQRWGGFAGDEEMFDTLLVVENYPQRLTGRCGGAEVAGVQVLERTHYAATAVVAIGQQLELKLIYDGARVEAAAAQRLARRFCAALRAIGQGATTVGELLVLEADELRLVTDAWARQPLPAGSDATLPELVAAAARAFPERPAVRFQGAALTYAELMARSSQLARALRARGVGIESRVGLCAERSAELIVALLAILQAGAAYVPLDVGHPAARLALMVEEAGVALLLCDRRGAEHLGELPGVTALRLDGELAREALRCEAAPLALAVRPDHLAYLMYTSGSTGRPKGIATPHRAVVRLVRDVTFAELSPARVLAHLAPLAFDASTLEIWGALTCGATLVVAPPGPLSLAEIAGLVRDEGVDTMWMTAGLFHKMVEEHAGELASLRQLLAGGDVLSVAHVEAARRAFTDGAVINGYGPTETTTFACCYRVPAAGDLGARVPIGTPIQGTEVLVLDDELRPLGIDLPGELYIGGDGLARGYLRRPGLTAERFVPHPFGARGGERLYRTGDWVRWRGDGAIEFLGRRDAQVKLRGFRIELGEIEEALRAQPGVADAVVVAHGRDAADKRLVAYVVPAAPGELATESSVEPLRAALAARLPAYMIPSTILALAALPLTGNGKIDRRALPPPDAAPAAAEVTPPQTATERALAAIWGELLGLSQLDRRANFFQVGGHSLLAAQAIARVQSRLGVSLPLGALFQFPTLSELALAVERALPAQRLLPPIVASVRRRIPHH